MLCGRPRHPLQARRRRGSLYSKFTAALKQRWRVEDEGPVTNLLNIQIEREGDTITLKQTSYITKLCGEYFSGSASSHTRLRGATSMDIRECIIEATADGASPADPALASKYKRLVGALLYCATQTRPDVAYPVSMLCRAMSWPTAALMDAALRVLAYLYKHETELLSLLVLRESSKTVYYPPLQYVQVHSREQHNHIRFIADSTPSLPC